MPDLKHTIRRCLADVLGRDATALENDRHFAELGLDSLLGLRFAGKLGEALGMEIELEWLYDYPSIDQLGAVLAASTAGAGVQR